MSKLDKLNLILSIVQKVAPSVLLAVPHGDRIAPLIPVITGGIVAAEQIPGASGADKKAFVQEITRAAATTLNATGKLHLDPVEAATVAGVGIDAVIGSVNLVHAAHVQQEGILLPPANPPGVPE
jgi:hypothetical protein